MVDHEGHASNVGEAHAVWPAETRIRAHAVGGARQAQLANERRHDGSVDVDVPDRVVREIGDESKRARWRERHVVRGVELGARARSIGASG